MKTTRESVDPDVVSKMTPADRFAFVTKMREQGQKQFGAVKAAANELLATLDATQKAKAADVLPGLAFGPGQMRGAVRGRPAAQALTRSIAPRLPALLNPLGAPASRGPLAAIFLF